MKKLLVVILALIMCASLFSEITQSGNLRTRMMMYNTIGEETPTNTKIDTRLRMTFDLPMEEYLKAVWQLEVGDIAWGSNPSGDLGTDGVNVETKHLYLAYTCPFTDMDAMIGLQAWYDHRSLILDDDFAGIMLHKELPNVNLELGTAKLEETNVDEDDDVDLFFVNFELKTLGFGMQNVFQRSNRGKDIDAWLMPYYGMTMGNMSFDIMAAYNYGSYTEAYMGEDVSNGGFAVAVSAQMEAAANFGLDFLYTSGDDGSDPESTTRFNTISTYYMNGLEIFGYGINDGAQQSWAGDWDPGNGGLGLMSIVVTANYPMNEKMGLNFAAGMVNSIEGDETAMGTEFDLGMSYQLFEKLAFNGVLGYAMPGKFYGDDLDNIYELTTVLQYKF